LIASCLARGHESVIEHAVITVRIVCDRGVSHELVRHRLASYSQESTRYVDSRAMVVVRPCYWRGEAMHAQWLAAMREAERAYCGLLDSGAAPEEARAVLPNSLATVVVMTANIREWRHVLRLRCSRAAHPQMREIMLPLQRDLARRYPVLFGGTPNESGSKSQINNVVESWFSRKMSASATVDSRVEEPYVTIVRTVAADRAEPQYEGDHAAVAARSRETLPVLFGGTSNESDSE
jgi:thymidylate synthase (FAD)